MLYVHIPYCRKACHYCDFHFSTQTRTLPQMLAAIGTEAELWAEPWAKSVSGGSPLQSLYLGGGTPSLVPVDLLKQLFTTIDINFNLADAQEITLEANPEDVTPERARAWLHMGITRISLGVQTLDDALLPTLNRAHTAKMAVDAVHYLQKAGLMNITIDLMFGLPGQTMAGFKADVQAMLQLNVPHVSVYGFTLEERTVFGRRLAKGAMLAPDESLQADMMAWLHECLEAQGYDGYEISSYAHTGYEAIHNASYWAGRPYLGLGPGAHSFDGLHRWQNPPNNALYMKKLEGGVLPHLALERLSPAETFNERLLTGLRLKKGIDIAQSAKAAGVPLPAALLLSAANLQQQGLLQIENTTLGLTPAGRLLADFVTQKLMI